MDSAKEMQYSELVARMAGLDRAASIMFPGRRFRIVLAGGGAMILLGCLARATSDLDAVQFPKELVELMGSYDINGRVMAYLDHFPINFEDRLVSIELETESIDFFTASLEDIVTSKLYSNRDSDAVDVRRPEVLKTLDWALLDVAVREARETCLIERRYQEMLDNYATFRKECGPCED